MKMASIIIRLPEGLRDQLRDLSQANNRSMNGQVVELIKKAVRKSPPVPKPKGE